MTSFQLAPSSRNGSPRNSQQHDHVGGGGGGGGLRVSAGGGGTSHGIRFPGGGNATSFSATGSDPLGDSTLQGIGARVSSLDKGSGGKRADEVGRSGSFDTGKVSSSPGIAVATLEPSPPLSVPAVTPAQQNSGKKTHESGSALRNRIMGFGGPPSAFGATLKYD
ncbi:Hypothetical protein, putative [Bodo saltans]|uniref:Uncharacterized protein n=1 Tax=Bodo saltans TaxID=75058 RepID=A0A0S4IU06_BODSA|nr:Hypothetical protein, putative [Bodo saltans]|eukprot:CUF91031.1 Hypothetical protein, putative [Bodo saltans]